MGLKDSLKHDLTEAMRARDELLLSTIRLCLSAITNEEVSGKEARVLSEAEVIGLLAGRFDEEKNIEKTKKNKKIKKYAHCLFFWSQ
jgi:uncharacterized protein YqeY